MCPRATSSPKAPRSPGSGRPRRQKPKSERQTDGGHEHKPPRSRRPWSTKACPRPAPVSPMPPLFAPATATTQPQPASGRDPERRIPPPDFSAAWSALRNLRRPTATPSPSADAHSNSRQESPARRARGGRARWTDRGRDRGRDRGGRDGGRREHRDRQQRSLVANARRPAASAMDVLRARQEDMQASDGQRDGQTKRSPARPRTRPDRPDRASRDRARQKHGQQPRPQQPQQPPQPLAEGESNIQSRHARPDAGTRVPEYSESGAQRRRARRGRRRPRCGAAIATEGGREADPAARRSVRMKPSGGFTSSSHSGERAAPRRACARGAAPMKSPAHEGTEARQSRLPRRTEHEEHRREEPPPSRSRKSSQGISSRESAW